MAPDLTFAGLRTFTGTEVDATPEYYLYAKLPHHINDLPKDLFGRDGAYTLTAWAADAKDPPISPRTTLAFSVQTRVETAHGHLFLDHVANKPAFAQFVNATVNSMYCRITGAASGLYYDNGRTPGDPSDDTCGIDTPRLSPVPSGHSYNAPKDDTLGNVAAVGLTVTRK